MKFTDIRYLRTEKMIFDAFTKLLSQKPYEKITIQDIADEAMINRATFYAHYPDKDSLQKGIQTQIMEQLSEMIDAAQVTKQNSVQVKRAEKLLTDFYNALSKNPAIAKIASQSIGQEEMSKNFSKILREKYADLYEKLEVTESGAPVPKEFVISYLTGVFTSTLIWWINADFPMPSKELARLVITLISNGHLTVLGITIDRISD